MKVDRLIKSGLGWALEIIRVILKDVLGPLCNH